jgi:hypothetical protein
VGVFRRFLTRFRFRSYVRLLLGPDDERQTDSNRIRGTFLLSRGGSSLAPGYLMGKVAAFLINVRLLSTRCCCALLRVTHLDHSLYFSRHGESQYNVTGKLGGDSDLSERGQRSALPHSSLSHAPRQVFAGAGRLRSRERRTQGDPRSSPTLIFLRRASS